MKVEIQATEIREGMIINTSFSDNCEVVEVRSVPNGIRIFGTVSSITTISFTMPSESSVERIIQYPNFLIFDFIEIYEASSEYEVIKRLDDMSPKQILNKWLTWEGIIGYTDKIWEITNQETV